MKKLILLVLLLTTASISFAENGCKSEKKQKCEMVAMETLFLSIYGLTDSTGDLAKKFDLKIEEVEALAKKHKAEKFKIISNSFIVNVSSYDNSKFDYSISISAEYGPNSDLTNAVFKEVKANSATISRDVRQVCK